MPDVRKNGLVMPVYRSDGKDPLNMDSYKDVTWTSVFTMFS